MLIFGSSASTLGRIELACPLLLFGSLAPHQLRPAISNVISIIYTVMSNAPFHSSQPFVAFRNAAFAALLATGLNALLGCGGNEPGQLGHDAAVTVDAPSALDAELNCPAGAAGAGCVLALYARTQSSCAASDVSQLTIELNARRSLGPLWFNGSALFRSDAPRAVAGDFNAWSTTALPTARLCTSDLFLARGAVAIGYWQYKIVDNTATGAAAWQLDVYNPGFAFDAFTGNADGKNSVLNTAGSRRGHLVDLGALSSTSLGNTRRLTGYLPPDYNAPSNATRTYPTLFMHDGQNVFDDTTCCFGHTGWEINVALDREIAAGRVGPTIVVAADHAGANRNSEYGWAVSAGGKIETFVEFFVNGIVPRAAQLVRVDASKRFVAGSSLGGLISMRIALAHPDMFAGAGSFSGAFWPGQDTQTALRDLLPRVGKKQFGIYLDHGGTVAAGGDGLMDSVEIRDQLVALGWNRTNSPQCTLGGDALCYYHEPGATHDELAWRDRVWRMLVYFFPA